MAILHIFGDEFGTMPISDNSGPFLAATVFLRASTPALSKWEGRRPWLIEQLQCLGASPQVAVVRPTKGYSKNLQAKLCKMDTMARFRRMADGANEKYLNVNGLGWRNYIWNFCMNQAIVRAIAASVFSENVESVRVHLDQKTLTTPERNHFRKGLSNVVPQFREILAKFPNHKHVQAALRNWKNCADEPHITWSDEFSSPEFETGLKLAHYLAKYAGESLRKDPAAQVLDWLEDAGFRSAFGDVTDSLLAPLKPETVEEWKRATGLPEPR
jgi:hypothetical protein